MTSHCVVAERNDAGEWLVSTGPLQEDDRVYEENTEILLRDLERRRPSLVALDQNDPDRDDKVEEWEEDRCKVMSQLLVWREKRMDPLTMKIHPLTLKITHRLLTWLDEIPQFIDDDDDWFKMVPILTEVPPCPMEERHGATQDDDDGSPISPSGPEAADTPRTQGRRGRRD